MSKGTAVPPLGLGHVTFLDIVLKVMERTAELCLREIAVIRSAGHKIGRTWRASDRAKQTE